MARKALFATNDQPAGQSETDIEKQSNGSGGSDAAISVGAKGVPNEKPEAKRAVLAPQTLAQRRQQLGVDEGLLEAIKARADEKTINEGLREQAICCGELTLQRLTQAGHLSGAEAQSILESYGYYVEDVKAGENILDILAFHIWVKLDTKGERAEKEIRILTSQLTQAVPTGVTYCSFSRLSDTPTELFEKIPLVEKFCAALMCPVVQANERDFISVASVNPVTAAVVGLLLEEVMEREGVRPFSFVLTMSATSWTGLCEKQFSIEV